MQPGFQFEFDKTLFNDYNSNTFNDIEQKLFYPNGNSKEFVINEYNRLETINKRQSKEIIDLKDTIQSLTNGLSHFKSENGRLETINKRQSKEIIDLKDTIQSLTNDYKRLKIELSKELNEPRKYKVYIHLKPGCWIYIGQTCQELEERWQCGEGYKHNQMLYHQIQKYGWNNIQHLLYKDNLTKKEADKIEQDLIHFYAKNEEATGLMVLNLKHNIL